MLGGPSPPAPPPTPHSPLTPPPIPRAGPAWHQVDVDVYVAGLLRLPTPQASRVLGGAVRRQVDVRAERVRELRGGAVALLTQVVPLGKVRPQHAVVPATVVRHPRSDTRGQAPAVRHPRSDTRIQTPAVRHSRSDTRGQTPAVRHPQSDTCRLCTQDHGTQTLALQIAGVQNCTDKAKL